MQCTLVAGVAKQAAYAVVWATSSGSLGCIGPQTPDTHALLRRLQTALVLGLPHVAGLHPRAFRAAGVRGVSVLGANTPYGKPPASDAVLDGQLLWEWAMAPRAEQARLAHAAGCSVAAAVTALAVHAQATTLY